MKIKRSSARGMFVVVDTSGAILAWDIPSKADAAHLIACGFVVPLS